MDKPSPFVEELRNINIPQQLQGAAANYRAKVYCTNCAVTYDPLAIPMGVEVKQFLCPKCSCHCLITVPPP